MRTIPGASAASEYGQLIETSFDNNRRRFQETEISGVDTFLSSELFDTWHECRRRDWDGHDALPVTIESVELAEKFVRRLPIGTPLPTVAAEPDGQLTLEWHRGPRRTLSISFASNGEIHHAALIGSEKLNGVSTFGDIVPETILSLIQQTI